MTAVFGAVIGIVGKVIYDRRFAKRPDLRFIFGHRAKFGTGEREIVYQNLEVTNVGLETTTDVYINFKHVDLIEYQVSYDGPHDFKKTDEQVAILVPSLPPGDSVTLSFTFSPSKSNINKIQDLFLSARSKECVAKQLDRAKSTNGDWASTLVTFVASAMFAYGATVFFTSLWQTRSVQPEIKPPNELVRLTVQVPNPVASASEAEIECYIDNLANNPFVGLLRITAPWVDEMVFVEKVNVGAKSRKLVKWKLKVPNNVQSGKYRLNMELLGDAFDQPVSLRTTEMVEVRL